MDKIQSESKLSLAVVWTKYQYHILLALLRSLNIDRSNVVLIIFVKAQKNGVKGEGFYKTILYDIEESMHIKHWPNVKQELNTLLNELNLQPQSILLRSYDSAIGRVIMSKYPTASIYLFEDGTTSYKKRNFSGYPDGLKDKIRNILLRLYFSKKLLKILPVPQKNIKKAGLFSSIDPWLKVPYIPLKLNSIDIFGENTVQAEEKYTCKVLILEQPLWFENIDDDTLVYAYQNMMKYILDHIEYTEGAIALKLHPSSDKIKVSKILKKAGLHNKIKVLETTSNFEELLLSDALSSIQMIIGFYSSALYLVKALTIESKIKIVAFSTDQLEYNFTQQYELLKDMGITHAKEQLKK